MRLATLTASLLAAAVLAPGAADASPPAPVAADDPPFEDRVQDPMLDTSRYWTPEIEGAGPSAPPSFGALRAADIRVFAANHTDDYVTAIIKTGSLRDIDTTATLAVRTPGKVDYLLRFRRSADEETSVVVLGPTGETMECEDPSHGWIMDDYRWTTLYAPTACLGDPEWVRIGAATTGHAPGQRFGYADDARREGRADPDRAPRIGGPRLFVHDW